MAHAIQDGTVCACRRNAGVARSLSQFAVNAACAYWLAAQRRVQLRIRLALDDRLLADIGITRQQARQEASKSFYVWTGSTIPTVRSAP